MRLCSSRLQMPSRCRNALNIAITTLFAVVVLFTILLAYVTGCYFQRHRPQSPESVQIPPRSFSG